MLERYRSFLSLLLRPVASLLRGLKIPPNAVTIAGVVFFCAASFFTAKGRWSVAAACAIIGSCLDSLDGLLAKISGRATTFGAILDSSCDRITEIVWFGGMFAYVLSGSNSSLELTAVFLAVSGSLMISYVKARAEAAGIKCGGGLLQRPERLIIICVCLILGPNAMWWGLWLIAALSWMTVGQRFVIAWNNARAKDTKLSADGFHDVTRAQMKTIGG